MSDLPVYPYGSPEWWGQLADGFERLAATFGRFSPSRLACRWASGACRRRAAMPGQVSG